MEREIEMGLNVGLRQMLRAGAVIALSAGAGAQAHDRPVVVELFTSQGCSSCPPADAYLKDLADQRPDVLPLAFHVDYWDRLGWKDPYSSRGATDRQRGYAMRFGTTQIYTPQMVIDGTRQAVGSNRARVSLALDAAATHATPAVPLRLGREGGSLAIAIGAGEGSGSVLLVGFDPQRETAVERGENGGRTLVQTNIVRSFEQIAKWDGRALALERALPAGESAALLLQAPNGEILGAAVLEN